MLEALIEKEKLAEKKNTHPGVELKEVEHSIYKKFTRRNTEHGKWTARINHHYLHGEILDALEEVLDEEAAGDIIAAIGEGVDNCLDNSFEFPDYHDYIEVGVEIGYNGNPSDYVVHVQIGTNGQEWDHSNISLDPAPLRLMGPKGKLRDKPEDGHERGRGYPLIGFHAHMVAMGDKGRRLDLGFYPVKPKLMVA